MTTPSDGPSRANRGGPSGNVTFLVRLLDKATKAVPAAKYFWGVVAASVTVAFISLLNGLNRLTLVAIVAAIVLMFVFYIFSQFEKASDPVVKLLGYVLLIVAAAAFVFIIATSAWLALTCAPRLIAYVYGVAEVCYGSASPPKTASGPTPNTQPPTAPTTAPIPAPQSPAPDVNRPIAWRDDLSFWTAGSGLLGVVIRGTITNPAPVQLTDAYIISEITGEKKILQVETAPGPQLSPLHDINEIPPKSLLQLWATFSSPGISPTEFVALWGSFLFHAEYTGIKYEKMFSRDAVQNFTQMQFPEVGPHVTPKGQNK